MNRSDHSLALECCGVDFAYQEGTLALDGVDFAARQGEIVSILASNGSGKTTLIKVLVALLKPCRGRVRVLGRELSGYTQRELYQQVGLVLQNPRDQLFSATVEDDVAFAPRNLGLGEDEVQRRVQESLHAVGAGPLKSRSIHHLSFGEQKRVSLAGVLAMRPSILVLDEPTAGLDPAGEALMLGLLHSLNRERGTTVVMATHSVDMLPLFADRIYVLKEGRVYRHGTVAEVFSDAQAIGCAHLRLPYVGELIDQLKRFDGLRVEGFPLTVAEARQSLLTLLAPAPTAAGRGSPRGLP